MRENGSPPTNIDTQAEMTSGTASPETITLVMMPFLGGSWHEWKQVMQLLEGRYHCVGLDLPGFGGEAETPGYPVEEMAAYVEAKIAELVPGRFVLVGHSMAGKVSLVIASHMTDGSSSPRQLEGIVLVASSPPSPEPMSESKRASMIAKLGRSGPDYRNHAADFIHDNVENALPQPLFDRAVDDVLRMNPAAWRAWLESGSREDWALRVGELAVPALVIAGETDKDLGAAAQTSLTLPHLRSAHVQVIPGARHLIPMEQPAALAAAIADFLSTLVTATPPTLPPAYSALIESDRVSKLTEAALLQRATPDDPRYLPSILSSVEMTTLRAIADEVIPLSRRSLNFSQRVDKRLSTGVNKGWRYAALPGDAQAWKLALQSVEAYCRLRFGLPFLALPPQDKQTVLSATAAGGLESRLLDKALHPIRTVEEHGSALPLNGQQMQRWFEDLCAELTTIYVSHPVTLAEMGYSGIADGADSNQLSGFVKIGLGETEAWEPLASEVPQA